MLGMSEFAAVNIGHAKMLCRPALILRWLERGGGLLQTVSLFVFRDHLPKFRAKVLVKYRYTVLRLLTKDFSRISAARVLSMDSSLFTSFGVRLLRCLLYTSDAADEPTRVQGDEDPTLHIHTNRN